MSQIKEVEVKRGELGMWTHPDFPNRDEDVSIDDLVNWFHKNNGHWFHDRFERSASVELQDKWCKDGDCSEWIPECGQPGSFLLSIHDTDVGPVATFFCPNTKAS